MLPRPGVKRFLLVTLGITGLYLALNALWLAVTPSLAALFDARTESAWAREAAAVADAARDADARLPAPTRVAAYRLGFHVGYCSNILGSVALSRPETQSRVREILAPRIRAMQDLGHELGVGEVSLLPVSNADEFGRVNDRLDSDELGLAARVEKHGLSLRDRLVGYLPRYAPLASRLAPLANLRNGSPLLRKCFEQFAGISAQRKLPEWRRDVFAPEAEAFGPADGHEVVLFADTFNRAYERENLDAALRVLVEGGYRVHLPKPAGGRRPLCCGRTFLSAGLVDQARAELDRLVRVYAPFAARGVPIVGLEPSCLLTLRDELLSLRNDDSAKAVR